MVWRFVETAPYNYLFLRSSRLTVENLHDPVGRHDCIAMVPLTNGIGIVEKTSTPEGVYMKLPSDVIIRTIDFDLTDYTRAVVNLRGRPCSLEICLTEYCGRTNIYIRYINKMPIELIPAGGDIPAATEETPPSKKKGGADRRGLEM